MEKTPTDALLLVREELLTEAQRPLESHDWLTVQWTSVSWPPTSSGVVGLGNQQQMFQ